MRRTSGLAAIALLIVVARGLELALGDEPARPLWAGELAGLWVIAGLASRRPKLLATGVFVALFGLVPWAFLDPIPWIAAGSIIAVGGLGFVGLKGLGLPRGSWWRGLVFVAAVTVATPWFGGAAGNINGGHRLPEALTFISSYPVFIILAALVLALSFFGLERLLFALGMATPGALAALPAQERALAVPEALGEAPAMSERERAEAELPARDLSVVADYARHINPAFVKLLGLLGFGRLFTKARGCYVWDHAGRRYLDLIAGFGSVNVGHNHPRLRARIAAFLDEERLNFLHVGPSAAMGMLGARLAALAGPPLEVAILTNTGAEAVEAALKTARAATGRPGFVYCQQAYHGTSLGTLSLMGVERLRAPFEPLLPGGRAVPFGDQEALAAAVDESVAAVVIDPGLCEAGRITPPAGYLAAAQELCRARGALLVLDEVQTGLGRTGAMFAFEHEGFKPDILALAKSLSGGYAPIGAALTRPDIAHRAYGSIERFDVHNTTFGGNALSCAVALETLAIIEDEGLVENSRERGRELLEGLRERLADHPLVRDIRGRGLFVAVELGPTDRGWMNRLAPELVENLSREVFGQWAAIKLLERGVLCQPATQNWNILKIEPPLSLTARQVQEIIAAFAAVLAEYRGLGALVRDVSERLGQRFLAGWAF